MIFIAWFISAILVIIALYVATRLCSTAYYKSKQDFLTWLKKHQEEQ